MIQEKPVAKIRKVNFKFENPFPRYWANNNPIATHFMNAQHLVFPDGEKFFIRSVKAFADVYKNDPELKKRVENFIGQEGTHYAEHQKFWDIMESQGLAPMKFVNVFRATAWNGLEKFILKNVTKNRLGSKLALSITVGLEHFTAMLAESGINNKEISNNMPTEMKDLFLWDAAEEIEHKSIPFDVLKKVDDSYALRVGGMAIATWGLGFYILLGMIMLSYNDKELKINEIPKHIISHLNYMKNNFGGTLSEQFWLYFKKDFHPDQIDNYHLAAEILAGKTFA